MEREIRMNMENLDLSFMGIGAFQKDPTEYFSKIDFAENISEEIEDNIHFLNDYIDEKFLNS